MELEEALVPLLDNDNFDLHMKHIRAGVRVNSRASVAVEWVEDGRTLRAEGYTVDISPSGCLVVVPQGFAVGQKLTLINLTNSNKCDATLVWRGHEGRSGWELGLELQQPTREFWGLDF